MAGWGAIAIIVLVLHVMSFGFFEIDDAYISFRYAGNFLDGHGLLFNPGDLVEGYSNLLWVLLSAAGMAVGLDAMTWARIMGLSFTFGILALMPEMLQRLDRRVAWLGGAGAVLAACCGPLACWSFAGLETGLFTFLTLLAWRAAPGPTRAGNRHGSSAAVPDAA